MTDDLRERFPPDYKITLEVWVQGSRQMAEDIADDLDYSASRGVTVFTRCRVEDAATNSPQPVAAAVNLARPNGQIP